MAEKNLILPGNPRYQPKSLQEIFGYDNLFVPVGEVEIAVLQVMAEIGFIPPEEIARLTPKLKDLILEITTSEVDRIERSITRHDMRAWVRRAQEITGHRLGRWFHIPLTSYDPLDTARSLQFVDTYGVLSSLLKKFLALLASLVERFADTLQIGRTHGQHALPITVGFWLATILYRVLYNAQKLEQHAGQLVGKISGAVGAYNAEVGLQITERCGAISFEKRVLEKLELKPAPVSTQVLPPEPLAYYLFSCAMLSAALAQLANDCRHLARTEIGEIAEPFGKNQVGSSTMAHKRNPVTFENVVGTWLRTKNEFGKVFDALLCEHQRDLVGSSLYRDFPIIVINLAHQLESLMKEDENGAPFLARISVDAARCLENLRMSSRVILAEPIYIALTMAGYSKDAHKLINEKAVPRAHEQQKPLIEVVKVLAETDDELALALSRIPSDVQKLFRKPERYRGKAKEKALEIVAMARSYVDT